MSLSAQKSRLAALTRQIALDWADTKTHWQDAKAQEFEARHMVELTASVDRAVLVLEKLEALLARVRSDCE